MELDAFLNLLEQVTDNGDGQYRACCPAHDDESPSMSIKATEDGTILTYCFAGCTTDEIVAALGLTKADLFAGNGRGGRKTGGSAAPGAGLTLEQYTEDKMLPVEFLHGLGLRDHKIDGKPVVRIPFLDEAGAELTVKYRHGGLVGEPRFTFKSGTKARPYGLERLAEARAAGHISLVEGESDAQTLWFHGEPALGLPGRTAGRRSSPTFSTASR